jgi:hypothetical protein
MSRNQGNYVSKVWKRKWSVKCKVRNKVKEKVVIEARLGHNISMVHHKLKIKVINSMVEEKRTAVTKVNTHDIID